MPLNLSEMVSTSNFTEIGIFPESARKLGRKSEAQQNITLQFNVRFSIFQKNSLLPFNFFKLKNGKRKLSLTN